MPNRQSETSGKLFGQLITRKNWNKVKRMLAQGQWRPALRGIIRKLKQPESLMEASYTYAMIKERYLRRKNAITSRMLGVDVDIIVPVYDGMKYLERLLASIEKTEISYRLILIDDASPDPATKEFLQHYVQSHEKATLVRNAQNLGFVGSVNRGLAMARGHVVILNTDVELPAGWLERLIAPIVKDTTVASATPFTNSGTICSFPLFNQNNTLFNAIPVDQIDRFFQEIRSLYTDIPTGVGFCMAISKKALHEVGFLDQKTFGKGYGEENDWCQRAIEKGFRNVMVENLYVFHNHGSSFHPEEKTRLIRMNQEKLLAKHPDYANQVGSYLARDPMAPIRAYVFCRLTASMSARRYLIFHHTLGGGADAYIQNYARKRRAENAVTVLVRYIRERGQYQLEYQYQDIRVFFDMKTLDEVFDFSYQMDMNQVIINQMVTYPNLQMHLTKIREFAEDKGCRIMMMVHDYYVLCPSIYLLNEKQTFCHLPSRAECQTCLQQNPNCDNFETKSIEEWRRIWQPFLQACQEVRVFSQDSMHLVQKAYGGLDQVRVLDVQHTSLPVVAKEYKTTETLNIGLLGTLTDLKGAQLVRQMLTLAENRKANVRFILCGSSVDPIRSRYFKQTGAYHPAMLPSMILEYDIDLFFISSICPETFSYTTQEAMEMGMPVACLPLGAPAERVQRYGKGKVLSSPEAGKNLEELIEFGTKQQKPLAETKRGLIVIQEESYASRYRAEHLKEQLLHEGIVADVIEVVELKGRLARQYAWTVLYRCQDQPKIRYWIREAHRIGHKVWYAVDDLVFDYETVRRLDFAQTREYRGFEKVCTKIQTCMNACDGVLVSTEALKRELQQRNGHIPVTVQRNVASYEMIALSQEAYQEKNRQKEEVVLGYFSGSHTHDADLMLIVPVLTELMRKYPQLRIWLGGALEVPKELAVFADRLTIWPFRPWQELPKLLAGIDINLMPLQTSVFHECKSENKWLEAALVAVPTVASYNDELSKVIRDGETGLLCRDTAQWQKQLQELIDSAQYRQRIGEAARQEVLAGHTTQQIEPEVLAMFTES